VYDYYLGGTANWAIDREFGKKVLSQFPLARPIAKSNRLFLHRAVRYLARRGVRQFVDVGSGVPTMGPTHEVADQLAPDSHVVYVDNEPVAVAHSEMLLEQHGDPHRHAVINADLREPDTLWRQVEATGVIDISQPVALLLIAVVHFRHIGPNGDDIGDAAVSRYRELLAPGSYLAISQGTRDGVPADFDRQLLAIEDMYRASNSSGVHWRNRAETLTLFGDFELVEPGLTWTPLWHPEESGPAAPLITLSDPAESVVLAGVARKR
jgi:hypothetical protein